MFPSLRRYTMLMWWLALFLNMMAASLAKSIYMTASLTDARLTVSLDIATLQSVPDIDVTLESGSAGVGYTVSTEGVVTTAGASAQGFRVSLDVGADAIGLEASLDSASADLTAIGSPMAIDAEIRDVKVDASITSASQP